MYDWQQVKLGDVAESITVGHVGPMASQYQPTGVPFLRSQNVLPHRLDLSDVKYIGPEFHAKLRKSALRAGDVVTVRTGKPGATAIIPDHWSEMNCSDLVVTRPGNLIDSRWLSYYINGVAAGFISSQLVGAVQQHFNISAAREMLLVLPSMSEQQAIGEVLGALDDKISLNAKATQTIDEFLGVFFIGLLAFTPVEMTALGKIADINAESLSPALGGSLRYIDIASVGVGRYDFPEIVEWANAPSRARRRVRKGDTLWSTVRPNRRSHALNLSADPLLVASTGLAVLSPRETGFAYLYEVTKLAGFTTYLESTAEGSAYPAVRADRFGEAPVPLLPTRDREMFESIAAPMRDQVFSLAEQDRILALTRDVLLPQLMSGRIRVKDAEKTVEEVL